jgi:GR25 family glycosyltransferase involved in LPS biosynthesis
MQGMTAAVKAPSFFDIYLNEMIEKIALYDPDILTNKTKKKNLIKNLEKRKVSFPVDIINNYKNTTMGTDTDKLLDIYVTKKPTISGYGVLFHNTETKENVPGRVLKYLLSERKVKKKEMLNHVNDVDKTIYNNLDVMQKVIKVLANAYYGAFGERSFHFFNPFLGPSTTYTGQHIILSAIMGFEGLLTDNINYENFNEIILFLNNVKNKEQINSECSLGFEITTDELIERYVSKCNFDITEHQVGILTTIFDNAEPEIKEKWYCKNNLKFILDQPEILEIIASMVSEDFLNPEKPPEDIQDTLNWFNEVILYLVGYEFQVPDKDGKSRVLKRKCILVTDTDSTFIYLDPFVKTVESFFERVLTPKETVSTINIITYVITHYIAKVFYELTKNYNCVEKDRKLINMKNEFMFSKVMLTKNKKSYACRIIMQEGKMFTEPKYEIKGISIKKTTTAKTARKIFAAILQDQILNKKVINPLEPFTDFLRLEKNITSSLLECKTDFLKPGKFSSLDSYVNPLSIQAARGTLLWNTLHPENKINNISTVWLINFKEISNEDLHKYLPPETLKIIEEKYFNIKVKINASAKKSSFGDDVEESDIIKLDEEGNPIPEKEKVPKTIKDYGIEVLAIPKNLKEYPEEFKSMIDITAMVNGTMKNGNILLECLGFKLFKSFNFETASNVVRF